MFIPEKKELVKEIEILENEEIKQKLLILYDHLLGKKNVVNVNVIVKEVITELFPNRFSTDVMIPLAFHDTLIAKLLFSIIYCKQERMYGMQEVIELTKTDKKPSGFTRQYLGQEIQNKNLHGEKKGGRWLFKESEVNRYLAKKGITNINKQL